MQSFGWVHGEVLPQISASLSWLFRKHFANTFPNVGLHQTTWGASKSWWRLSGFVIPLLRDASKSLISEDERLLDADHRPLAFGSYYIANHWLVDNGATTYCMHSHRGAICTVPLSRLKILLLIKNTVT